MARIIISLAIGFIIGYKKFISDKLIVLNSRMQTVWLVILIFSMGTSIGANKEILEKLPALGGKALLFAAACCIGSVLMVYLFSFFIEKDKK